MGNQLLFFDVLFEDDCILAVNKKSGVPSHSLQKDLESAEPTTVEAQVRLTHPEAQILHRLDNGTSGVLLFAKNSSIYKEIREQFKLKLIKKFYLAWSARNDGIRLKLPMKIDASLGHHPKSAKRMVVVDSSRNIPHHKQIRGKTFPAVTWIHKAEATSFEGRDAIELKVQIETGVTHQIRAHLAHLGVPLIGDRIYNRTEREQDPENKNSTRLGLHAQRVEFLLNDFRYVIVADKIR
ncbi:MAG: RluA family pseudouridine synthase [Bdellovibrionales bacterium]|nr:RluA family pseudouridine synthase [Bdellovibrionales bacterium]